MVPRTYHGGCEEAVVRRKIKEHSRKQQYGKYCQLCGYDGDFVNERQYEEELCCVVSKNRPE